MSIEWAAVERWLELPLPSDYKAFVDEYGPVAVGELVIVEAPCVRPGFDYGTWVLATGRRGKELAARAIASVFRDVLPTFHPGRSGLLPWGSTMNGNLLYWDTSAGDPDRWTTVVLDHEVRDAEVEACHATALSATELIAAIVREGITLPSGRRLGPTKGTLRQLGGTPWPVPETPIVSPQRRRALMSGTGLAALTALVPPPEQVPDRHDWERLSDALGTRLPTEYVALMDTYGSGEWLEWLYFRQLDPQEVQLGGLLPFASTMDADRLAWLTEGEPDAWPVIHLSRHFPGRTTRAEHDLTTTLLDWVRGGSLFDLEWEQGDDPLEVSFFESFQPF